MTEFVIWPALVAFLAIVAFGYFELTREASATAGLTTWMFATAPMLAVLYLLGANESLSPIARGILMLGYLVATAAGLSYLYKRARSSKKQSDQEREGQ